MTKPVGIWGISVSGLFFPLIQYLLLQEILLDFGVPGGWGAQHGDCSCLPLQPQHIIEVLP